jgi:NAD+ kinase
MRFHFVVSMSPKAESTMALFQQKYTIQQVQAEEADVFVVLGGDGFMLKTMRELRSHNKPFYGINCGNVGFLLNNFSIESDNFEEHINDCVINILNPLNFEAITVDQKKIEDFAINEVALLRHGPLAARIKVFINGKERIQCSGDGILLSTPAGSTAYNASARGPILPLTAHLLALTPLCVYKPRNWQGAILNDDVSVCLEIQDAHKRSINLTYDHLMVEYIEKISISIDKTMPFRLLFIKDTSLEERILKEQFA